MAAMAGFLDLRIDSKQYLIKDDCTSTVGDWERDIPMALQGPAGLSKTRAVPMIAGTVFCTDGSTLANLDNIEGATIELLFPDGSKDVLYKACSTKRGERGKEGTTPTEFKGMKGRHFTA